MYSVAIRLFLPGVGIDGGNSKEWEANARSIQLIKQSGKVKALDDEITSKTTFYVSLTAYLCCQHL